MFKLPSQFPTSEDSIEVLTDYFEFECIKFGEISILRELNKLLLQNDEILIEGTEDETDEALIKAEEIAQEMQRRQLICDFKYPFILQNNGYNLIIQRDTLSYWVYLYLLFSTRLNMNTHKNHDAIDGTKILERLSAVVAQSYFGERSQSLVFGTAVQGGFELKVNDLCRRIGEGKQFINRDSKSAIQQDDKLDVVVWLDFQDKRWSKVIGFGQCKTGTTFDDQATIELQPDDFCAKWFLDTPVVTPIKMFFCSQYYPLDDYSKARNAGLVFDRMRMMDCLPKQIDEELYMQIVSWCSGVIHFLQN
jgi:hypothetical protein